MVVLGFWGMGAHSHGVLGHFIGASPCVEGVGQYGAWCRLGGGRSPFTAHVYKVGGVVTSVCMVYGSPCWRWVMRSFGAVISYTWVVCGRWRAKEILAALFLRAVVSWTM